jgi:hypothetical protein
MSTALVCSRCGLPNPLRAGLCPTSPTKRSRSSNLAHTIAAVCPAVIIASLLLNGQGSIVQKSQRPRDLRILRSLLAQLESVIPRLLRPEVFKRDLDGYLLM